MEIALHCAIMHCPVQFYTLQSILIIRKLNPLTMPIINLDSKPILSKAALLMLAFACGITVGNVYLCQPLLHQIALSFEVNQQQAGLIAVCAQTGYALGILLIVPLADRLSPRLLVRALLILTSGLLLVVASATHLSLLLLASAMLTASTVIPQILIPVVSGMVKPAQRFHVLSLLQTGLIAGILLSRTVSGSLAQWADNWRAPYWLAAVLTVILIPIIPRLLPAQQPKTDRTTYLQLLRTLPALLTSRALQLSMLLGFLTFGAFSAFWTTLAFHLSNFPQVSGPAEIGLFGLYGAPGALLAPQLSRRCNLTPAKMNRIALFCVFLALILASVSSTWWHLTLILAVNLLDFGLQSGQIANQLRIFELGAEVRARLNTLYMVATFSGGALGALAGIQAFKLAGWYGVCMLGGIMLVLAALSLYQYRRISTAPSSTSPHR